MRQALIRGRHGQQVRLGGVSWGRCRAPRYRSLSFPPTIQSAPVASGQNCSASSWMLAKLERGRAGKRTRQLRRWASMLADVGPAIPSHCPTSRYPMSSRRWSESRPSAAAWFTRGRHGRSARTRREARSGWRGRLSRDSSRAARPLPGLLPSRLVSAARAARAPTTTVPRPAAANRAKRYVCCEWPGYSRQAIGAARWSGPARRVECRVVWQMSSRCYPARLR
jgi:hypothetical protein